MEIFRQAVSYTIQTTLQSTAQSKFELRENVAVFQSMQNRNIFIPSQLKEQ